MFERGIEVEYELKWVNYCHNSITTQKKMENQNNILFNEYFHMIIF